MATRLYRAGVPMTEIVEMGEWEDEAMARTYIRTLQAFAGVRRNLSEVVSRQPQATTEAAGAAPIVASGAGAMVAAAGTETAEQAAVARGVKRTAREAEMAICCPVKYVAQGGCVLCTKNLDEDATLRGLWEANAHLTQGKLAKVMCSHEYHCSPKQVHNCRQRLKERERCLSLGNRCVARAVAVVVVVVVVLVVV